MNRPTSPPTTRYRLTAEVARSELAIVHQAEDELLARQVTLRVLPEEAATSEHRRQFLDDAQALARLAHPAIPPVHDVGILPDGRLFWALTEVEGQTLREVVAALHDGHSTHTLHSTVDAIRHVARGLAHAHERGVLHGDVDPDSIILGEDGQVVLMDWGAARSPIGAPAYRAPERFTTGPAAPSPPSPACDVYALGALLYLLLTSEPPYEGPAATIPEAVRVQAPPDAATRVNTVNQPPGLLELCRRAMHRDANQRGSAKVLADDLSSWLDRRLQQGRARQKVEEARSLLPRIEALRQASEQRQALAEQVLEGLHPLAPEGDKAPGWALVEEAAALRRESIAVECTYEQKLGAALAEDSSLAEAHESLARLWAQRHAAAEAEGRELDQVLALGNLRAHAEALPPMSTSRAAHLQYIEGHGAVSLRTEPPGAQVWLQRYTTRSRRRVAEPVRLLGRTPLAAVPVQMGSYRLKLVAPERDPVWLPIHIPRGHHADGAAPGTSEPALIALTPEGTQSSREVRIAAGWFAAGGDPEALNALPAQQVWLDEFIMQRFPVTHGAFIEFVESVRLREGLSVALTYAPRDPGPQGDNRRVFYDQGPKGQLLLGATLEGDVVEPDWPVTFITWHAAMAYAAWFAEQTGLPWRLPRELEWEKAARGVDGRRYPWGDVHDPVWAAGLLGRDPVLPEPVDSYPVDISPYGVRGIAGNAQDWCLDPFVEGGAVVVDGVPQPIDSPWPQEDVHYTVRGGGFATDGRWARVASRGRRPANARAQSLGFRLVRSAPSPTTDSQTTDG